MSLSFDFKAQEPQLKRLALPTRYYHFNEHGNYIKLLNVGEGLFPDDKINLKIKLERSDCVISTESATKVYPSTSAYGINRFDFALRDHSSFEYINDELILFKESKYLQLFTVRADASSHFFYTDIISSGRSFEHFDFSHFMCRNRFIIDDYLEYYERFSIDGAFLKEYYQRHNSTAFVHAKVYIKSTDNLALEAQLRKQGYKSFTFTRSKKMLIGVLSDTKISTLKQTIHQLWDLYRAQHNKHTFNLGKQ